MRATYFLIIGILFFTACSKGTKKESQLTYFEDQGEIFHTYYHIKYEYDKPLTNEIMAELKKFDNSLNPFNDSSIIAKINRNDSVEVDSFFIEVFNKSMEVSRNTNGMFDITCAPFVNLWGFGFEKMNTVNQHMIDSLKQFVGYRKVRLEGNRVVKSDSRLELNTSAISKGYSTDLVCKLFDSIGVKNYMCEIGGEIRMKGVNPKGEKWIIGISKPIDDTIGVCSDIQTMLQISNKSVATSGNYRNFYIKNGKKYAHTINPLTGYPSEQDILSATVVADDCMTADAYATAFMALGVDASEKLVQKLEGVDYYFIYIRKDGSVGTKNTKGFEQYIMNKN